MSHFRSVTPEQIWCGYLAMSLNGTFRGWRDVRLDSVMRSKADCDIMHQDRRADWREHHSGLFKRT